MRRRTTVCCQKTHSIQPLAVVSALTNTRRFVVGRAKTPAQTAAKSVSAFTGADRPYTRVIASQHDGGRAFNYRRIAVSSSTPRHQLPQLNALPDALDAASERHLAPLADELTDDVGLSEHLLCLFAMSDFIPRSLQQQPGLLAELLDGPLWQARSLADYQRLTTEAIARAGDDEMALLREFRRFRRSEMVRIAWRDLAGLSASTAETLAELTDFAQACIAGAVQHAHSVVAVRHGQPRDETGEAQELIAIGMGKLGGAELNFSSDIDLIFVFAESGETDGRKPIDNQQFFVKVAQRVIKTLGETTADGFVFRVDMRLRPFGNSGPLALNFDALEAYYHTQGREWERYAMIKARALCGRPADIKALEKMLAPFIYRRYLDYGAIESLRNLKATMVDEMKRRGLVSCVKLGVGGIREIEFIGQSFQLVRGGRERLLQQRGILPVLACLGEMGLLDNSEACFLPLAYDFLRRLENRLQMLADQQTHALPTSAIGEQRMAYAMGYDDWDQLLAEMLPLRERVHAVFRDVFHLEEAETVKSRKASPLAGAWGYHRVESISPLLAEAGFLRPEATAEGIYDLHQGGFYARLSSKSQERLDKLMPLLLEATTKTAIPDQTLERLISVIRTIAGRSVYLQVLLDNPAALQLLVRLCEASGPVADFIAKHPLVLDELLHGEDASELPNREQIEAQARALLEPLDFDDLEQQMELMRQFKHGVAMRVAVADVLGQLPVMKVSDYLTWLAEAILTVSLEIVWKQMAAKHGEPLCVVDGADYRPDMAIVAYGKLGGIELSYTSDLDIVFLHDSHGSDQFTDGEKSLDNAVFFGRVVQRLTHFLSTLTPGGLLYETDTRLRPNGKGGVLVSSIEAFADYQRDEAWVWEHQAIIRARVVVGPDNLREAFKALRRDVLYKAADKEDLRQQVRDMRDRMRTELSRSKNAEFDIKQDRGGIADIEFMVQYGVLASSARLPALLRNTDNVRQIEAAVEAELLSKEDADDLIAAYLHLREITHKRALQGEKALVELDDATAEHRNRVMGLWQRVMLDE